MQANTQHRSPPGKRPERATRLILTAALAVTAGLGMSNLSTAAEISLSGTGSFRPPSAERLASLPPGLAFSRADLESGTWSFSVRYEDGITDADPDFYVGRYLGAIRAFRVVIGSTTFDLPVDQAQIVVTDGGGGFANRESIRLEAKTLIPSGLLRLAWVQVNQKPVTADLRGAQGVLSNDAIPSPAMVSQMATANPFDRFLELRLEGPGGASRPLLYLSSSKLSVTARPAAAP